MKYFVATTIALFVCGAILHSADALECYECQTVWGGACKSTSSTTKKCSGEQCLLASAAGAGLLRGCVAANATCQKPGGNYTQFVALMSTFKNAKCDLCTMNLCNNATVAGGSSGGGSKYGAPRMFWNHLTVALTLTLTFTFTLTAKHRL